MSFFDRIDTSSGRNVIGAAGCVDKTCFVYLVFKNIILLSQMYIERKRERERERER